MTRQTKQTALYARLSRDDELHGESGSIQNQKAMLEDYAARNGFSNIAHFCDDGFSGGTFDRPGWKAMIAEIEAGNIGTVIVKDMSRIGRDYLQTGYYTEVFFREKGVRFIAISNNIDSKNQESGEFAPFLNIMSEWFLRDTSRKIKASFKTKGKAGKRLTHVPIYGYMCDPNDKSKWLIDPEAAEVVQRIFALTVAGNGPFKIARILASEKIPRPTHSKHTRGIMNYENRNDPALAYAWSGESIGAMIAKPEYMGHTVNFRFSKESYKDKRSKENPKEDWLIFENTHPAIIDPETWETAQKCRQTKRRTNSKGQGNPFTGLVFCADCGAKLYNHQSRTSTQNYYACSAHTKARSHFEQKCSAHYIRTATLGALTLEVVERVSAFVKTDEAEFVRRVREDSEVREMEMAKAHRKRLAREQKRITELDTLIRKIYEDNVSGKLSDKRFEALSQEYEQEQTELEQSVAQVQAELDTFTADSNRADRFIEIVKRHTDFSELTPTMIAEFVEKVIVHQADKSGGERDQDVEVYLNFIGKFEVPIPDLTPEEMEAEELARYKRTRHREAQRKYLAKQEQQSA